jgi:hypothetical protein
VEASSPGHEDPLAADRRTLIIAVVAMVVLVAVGVGSAAVFTRSACTRIGPDPLAAGAAGTGVEEVLSAAFADADDAVLESMSNGVTALAGVLGPVRGMAEVGEAERLASLGDDGVAAIGPTTTVLDPTGATITAAGGFREGATVVGSGGTLYSLALVNELTGQVDALLPVDRELTARTCVDTATVGTQLAFHLAAGDGELLLLRVDEDGDDARVELRDPVAGRVWASAVDVARAPAGIMGERLTGRLGPGMAVLGGRTTEEEQTPVLAALERTGGEVAWTVERDALAEVLSGPVSWVDPIVVTDEIVVALVSPEASRGTGRLIGLGAVDGSLAWIADLGSSVAVLDASEDGDRLLLAVTGEGRRGFGELHLGDGSYRELSRSDPASAGAAVASIGDRRMVVTEQAVDVVTNGSVQSFSSPLVGRDAVTHPGGVTLLFGGSGGGGVAVTFGR